MDQKNLIHPLFCYTEIEDQLRTYYEKHHALMPLSIFENSAMVPSRHYDAAFQANISLYSEKNHIPRNSDIVLSRHLRYFPITFHTHEFIEISYVYSGSCTQIFSYQNGTTEKVPMSKGTVCIIPPGIFHSPAVTSDAIVINILIRIKTLRDHLTSFVSEDHLLSDFFIYVLYDMVAPHYLLFRTETDLRIHSLIEAMFLENFRHAEYCQKAISLMLGLFFTYLQRDYSNKIEFSQYLPYSIIYIPRIYEFIEKNYQTVCVQDIAAHLGVSPSYLSRLVKKYTNTTLSSLIQRVRIKNACDYLANTSLSVQQICELTGYESPTFFIRVFKKHIGCTPLQYRKRLSPDH